MTPVLIGQLLGIAFAGGLNLYATVATLGLLSRFGIIGDLPYGLQGLEGGVVIGSALVLYLVETILEKIPHADSLWDTVHTFIRPPAAALLALGALWTAPMEIRVGGTALTLLVALAVHGTRAGFRLSLNASRRERSRVWLSVAEDLTAIAFAIAAFQLPGTALVAGAVLLLVMIFLGPRLWRAFGLGIRCLFAWFRALFTRSRWLDEHELPGDLRQKLGASPIGTAPPRGARAGLDGVSGIGAYRNGWLVLTRDGPVFLYRTLLGARMVSLPPATRMEIQRGLWADLVHFTAPDRSYTLFLLKDGPTVDIAVADLGYAST